MTGLLKAIPHSLQNSGYFQPIENILQAAIQAVEPQAAVRRVLHRADQRLIVGDHEYDLQTICRRIIVGAGKASLGMAYGVAQVLGAENLVGAVVTKVVNGEGSEARFLGNVKILIGGHPMPDKRSFDSTQQVIDLLQDMREDDLVFCLISGGGSALLAQPIDGVSAVDLQELTKALLASGATIDEINIIRKHLDQVKGGGLLRITHPARVVTLILSDVVGNPLDIIASGPTVPDPSTFDDAIQILKSYQIWESATSNVREMLNKGANGLIPETMKPANPAFDRVQNILIGSNQLAAEAAIEQARLEGFHALLLTTFLQGEALQAGKFLSSIARQVDASGTPIPRPACIVIGGETTVALQSGLEQGLGGRNQEVALGSVESLSGLRETMVITFATDGEDAMSGAAGAVATGKTLARAREVGMDPTDFLRRHDSFHFFQNLSDLLVTGPTGTNVNDLSFIFLFPDK